MPKGRWAAAHLDLLKVLCGARLAQERQASSGGANVSLARDSRRALPPEKLTVTMAKPAPAT